jgi:predicted ATP-binding protein involved in virulence
MTVMARTSKKTQAVEETNKMPIAYFLSLEVDNVFCFEDSQVLDLSDKNGNPAQWTVILGNNGVGKTTLLRCIAGMSFSSSYYKKTPMTEEELEAMSPIFKNYFHPYEVLKNSKNRDQLFDEFTWNILSKMACGIKLSQFMINSNDSNNDFDYFWNIYPGGADYTLSADYAGLICYGYGATRKVGKSSLTEEYYQENSASLFSENASLINAEEWLLQADYSSKYSKGQKQKDLQKQINDIKEIFKKALPDVEDVDIFLDELQDSRPQLRFLMPYAWIPFVDMGLGYKTMITWILDLVIRLYKRYPESDDPLSEPAIVLVDEIDLHLHPKWQRTIMSFLTERFPNTQFIVTAHSPLVVQAAQDANIVLLRREGDRVVIDNNPEIIDNWRVDQILTSLFELPSARSATLDPLLKRREEILTKPKLTPKDKAELKEIAEKIGHLPTGETPEDIQAMDIIRRAAKLLEQQEKS